MPGLGADTSVKLATLRDAGKGDGGSRGRRFTIVQVDIWDTERRGSLGTDKGDMAGRDARRHWSKSRILRFAGRGSGRVATSAGEGGGKDWFEGQKRGPARRPLYQGAKKGRREEDR